MSKLNENQELQIYLKNTFKKEIDPNAEDEGAQENLNDMVGDEDEQIQDAIVGTDGLLYEENLQEYAGNTNAVATKIIQIRLDRDLHGTPQEEVLNDNQEAERNQFEIYEYNESVVIEDDAEKSILQPNTVHIVSNEKPDEAQKCPQCDYTTNKRFLLTRHLKIHSDDRPFKCNVCERGFKSNAALLNHVNTHLGNKPHHCKACEMRFNTGSELARHIRYRHTKEKPHKCGECDYSSVELSKMRRHMRMHTGERPYQCPHCTYASPDTFKLKRHLRTHTGEKPYECDICMARFTQSNSLKSHKLIHSVGERPVFQCTLCPTTCGRKTDLQLHIQKLHTSDHPIKCKRCGKELPDRYTYKVHVKTHDGEKCYRCSLCKYASISQRHLDMHMLIHTDEKPFACEQCDMSFRHRQLLQRHVNIYHTKGYVPPTPQQKNHTCPHCRRAFLRKGNLMRHMEIHDGKLTNDAQKASPITMHIKRDDDGSHNIEDTNDFENDDINYVDDSYVEDEEDIIKFEETFELVDDTLNESIEAKEELEFIYKSSNYQTDEFATTSRASLQSNSNGRRLIKTEMKTRPSNAFFMPTASPKATKKLKQSLPIKIDISPKDEPDFVADNDNVVLIEVIEDDSFTEDGVDSGETNCVIAGDVLEVPLEVSTRKHENLDDFRFVDNDEYVLPVEIADDD